MQEYAAMWKNYVNFKDRTTVRGYWMAFLFNFIAGIILSVLGRFVGIFSILYILYAIAVCIPGIAMGIRRLHDINKSGWWFLIVFIPLVGAILLLVWFCKGSVYEGNQYGTTQV